MSQATSLLKVASTHALLCFLEEHRTMRDFTMENPVKAIRDIALHTDGRTIVQLANGTTATALEIQQEYCNVVTTYAQESGLADPLLTQSLELWQRTLTAIETDRLELVNRDIDWVIKYSILQRASAKQGIDMADARMAQLDMAYHDINPDRGLYHAMERKGLVPTVVGADAINAARTQPPATTRAKLRGDFVAAALNAGADHTVDWTQLKLSDHGQRSVQLKDPFEAVDARVDRLIATL
jgi:proteasome accessory factor A